MKIERYNLESDDTLTRFEFTSEGFNGRVQKIIEFQTTSTPRLYNLAFGDKDPLTGEMNDLAVTNNGDTDKVLATVIIALYTFFHEHPDAFVYATGSTPSRTRLYRMGIVRFYEEARQDFILLGREGDEFYDFKKGKEYTGFLVRRNFA